MNCPHHCEIYKNKASFYKDFTPSFCRVWNGLPLRANGELHGLTRIRGFTQDDAHIFCTQEQVKEEFIKVIDLVLYILKR